MTVVIKLDTGDSHHLNRSLRLDQVSKQINEGRGKGKLIEFSDNRTPSRTLHVDPDHVVSITDDGYSY